MKAPFLIGTKVYLRPLEKEDALLLRTWINDPEVTRTLQMHRPMNLAAEEAFIERTAKSEHEVALGIALRADDRLIGTTGLHLIDFKNRSAGFGIEIGEKQEWGKGYATEATFLMTRHAFETLNMNRVWLHVHEHNPAGVRAYERVGYRREGVLRQHHFREGRYWDTYVMAILREEWEERRRVAAVAHTAAAPGEVIA
jgi:RimJ/RimL family protein N-acetyltransferase